jgi:hypothetical protein
MASFRHLLTRDGAPLTRTYSRRHPPRQGEMHHRSLIASLIISYTRPGLSGLVSILPCDSLGGEVHAGGRVEIGTAIDAP